MAEFSEALWKIKDLPNTILQFSSCFFAWILFLVFVLPVGTITFGLLYLWKKFVVIPTAKLFRPELLNPLDPFDSILAIDDFYGKCYANLGISLTIEGHIDANEFRRQFAKNVLDLKNEKGERVFQKMLLVPSEHLGFFFWKKSNDFDIAEHIREVSESTSQHDFQRYCGEWMTAPYPKGKPLWEILVHTNYDSNHSAATIRIHHSISDGLTLVKTFDAMTQCKSLPNFTVRNPTKKSIWSKMNLIFKAPLVLGHLYLDNMLHENLFTKPKKSGDAVVSWTALPRDSIRLVRQATESHFAIVGMSLLAGALQKHMKSSFDRDTELEKKDMRILVPLPWAKHPNDRMVNQWTMGVIRVPSKHSNAKDWLKLMQSEFISEVQSGSPLLARYSVPFITLFPAWVLRLIFRTNWGMSVAFTSVPGSNTDTDLFLMGHRLTKMVPLFGLQWRQTAVTASVFTYKDQAFFTVTGNKDILPNQEAVDRLVNVFVKEKLEEILHQVQTTSGSHLLSDNNNMSSSKLKAQ